MHKYKEYSHSILWGILVFLRGSSEGNGFRNAEYNAFLLDIHKAH
jgi:hypothetical protein